MNVVLALQAVKHAGTLYVSGQVPLVPGTKSLVGEGIEEQTEQALKNLGAILEAAGSSYSMVLKTTVLLIDIGDFAKVNEVYGASCFQTCAFMTGVLHR